MPRECRDSGLGAGVSWGLTGALCHVNQSHLPVGAGGFSVEENAQYSRDADRSRRPGTGWCRIGVSPRGHGRRHRTVSVGRHASASPGPSRTTTSGRCRSPRPAAPVAGRSPGCPVTIEAASSSATTKATVRQDRDPCGHGNGHPGRPRRLVGRVRRRQRRHGHPAAGLRTHHDRGDTRGTGRRPRARPATCRARSTIAATKGVEYFLDGDADHRGQAHRARCRARSRRRRWTATS